MNSEIEKALNENLLDVHKELINWHHTFKKCIENAMQQYAKSELEKVGGKKNQQEEHDMLWYEGDDITNGPAGGE